jgi:imidazolonepropionase-like amidohydrolase
MVEVVDAALRLNTIHTPALINEDVRRTLGAPTRFPPHPQLDALPSFWNQVWRGIWHAPNLGHEAVVYEGFREKERELLRMMFDRGVTVFAGTDTLMPFVAPGASLIQELQNFVAVGRTPEQALVTATTSPGTFWNDRTFGRIRPDLPADLVLYERDPTLDLGNLETRRWVIADGRIYDALQLKRWLEAYGAHFHAWPYETVMNIAIGFLSGDYAKGSSDK